MCYRQFGRFFRTKINIHTLTHTHESGKIRGKRKTTTKNRISEGEKQKPQRVHASLPQNTLRRRKIKQREEPKRNEKCEEERKSKTKQTDKVILP
jgi:hypothetical protein